MNYCITCHRRGLLKDDSLCPVCLGTGYIPEQEEVVAVAEELVEVPKKAAKPVVKKTAPKKKTGIVEKVKRIVRRKK